jgi:hypothetical protein
MKIKTGLPHEHEGGETIVLFGKPRIKYQTFAGHMVYVDCHVLFATPFKPYDHRYTFENKCIDIGKCKPGIINTMRSHAKKLAQAHIQKKGWVINEKGSEFIQVNSLRGFYFKVKM